MAAARGERVLRDAIPCAALVTEATLAPLATAERTRLLALLESPC